MKKLISFMLTSLLVVGATACNQAKTSSEAPNSPSDTGGKMSAGSNQNDANSPVPNQAAGNTNQLPDKDIKSLVRNQLEKNLPSSQLTVESKDGVVTVTGQVASADQLNQIEPLARKIPGVKSVNIQAKVASQTK
ncbi:MAG: BON domain-containing protein [Oscillatoria princeps RMCB-10]|jgi:hypothetical protein|nr:BON domain-containing protein [Oscillatoria princeps RMCB-10]